MPFTDISLGDMYASFKLYVKLIYKKEYPLQKVIDKLLSNWYYNHLNTNAKSVLQWMTKVKRKVKKGGE